MSGAKHMEKIVFMDRDGTINEEVNYLFRSEDMKLLPGAARAIGRLNRAGFRVVVATNQAGVARGYYTEEDVRRLHRYMNEELEKEGAHIDRFFFCPHHPQAGLGPYRTDCECRKPKPGLLRMAEQEYEVDKAHSYMIGDKLADVQAGQSYGVTGILVGTGYGKEERKLAEEGREPLCYAYFAENLEAAADWILEREKDGLH